MHVKPSDKLCMLSMKCKLLCSCICGLFKKWNIFANNMLNHEWAGGESDLLLNMRSAVLALQTQRPGELISAWSHWRCLFRHWMLTWKWPIWGVHSVSIGRMRQLGQCPARWERDTISASFCALCVDTGDGGETCCSFRYTQSVLWVIYWFISLV